MLIGHGRVGQRVAASLTGTGHPIIVIEADQDRAEAMRAGGVAVVHGNAADTDVLRCANVSAARRLLVAIPSTLESDEIVAAAWREDPIVRILAHAHGDEALAHLTERGADQVVMGEQEIAQRMLEDG